MTPDGDAALERRQRAGLAAIALGALSLNLLGATWGLPARWHPDEKADVAARMASETSVIPDSYINPSLPLLVMAPLVALQDAAARNGLLGGHLADPLLLGRGIAALAGAAAVWLLGCAYFPTPRGAGLMAPALLAVAPGVVNLCHFATPEAFLLLGTAGTLLLALRYVEGRTPAWALGLAWGLTVSTKYTGAALVAPVALAVILRPRGPATLADRVVVGLLGCGAVACAAVALSPAGSSFAAGLHLTDPRLLHPESAQAFLAGMGRMCLAAGAAFGALAGISVWRRTAVDVLVRRELAIVGVAAAAGFALGTPGALLQTTTFLSDLAYNAQTRHEYKGLVGQGTAFLPYLRLLAEALTLPILALGLVGATIVLARVRHAARAIIVLSAALAPFLLVAASAHLAMRFLVPSLPATAWLGALAISALTPRWLGRTVAALTVGRALVGALLVVRLFFVDSRVLAARFLAIHVPPGSTVDLISNAPGYAPSLPAGLTLRVVPTLSREMAPIERFTEAATRYPTEASEWLVLTEAFYGRFLDHPDQQPERARFFSDLLGGQSGFLTVARFRQQGWLRPEAEFVDPEIVVLRRRTDGLGH